MSDTVLVDLDGALGDTRTLWDAFLADSARRFATIARLDPAALPRDRVAAAAELDAWAATGVGDWRHALTRFAEDHAPVHLRPDPAANAALRALRSRGASVVVTTDAPEELARVALAHLGVARSVAEIRVGSAHLEGVVTTPEELAAAAGYHPAQ